jgi:hypothetical protein
MLQGRTHRHQAPTSEPREGSHQVQADDILGGATANASQSKGDGRDEETDAPPKDIGNAPIERLERCASDQVRSRQPRGRVGSVELGADDAVRGGRDSPIEAVEEHIGHERKLNKTKSRRRCPRSL